VQGDGSAADFAFAVEWGSAEQDLVRMCVFHHISFTSDLPSLLVVGGHIAEEFILVVNYLAGWLWHFICLAGRSGWKDYRMVTI
jgi:hypothetical protein